MGVAIDWILNNYIEIFGAVTGIIYVFLEIRQNIWLWPVGIVTSAVYIYVFFTGKLYADMSLQGYYLAISIVGWYWWGRKKRGRKGEGERGRRGDEGKEMRRGGEGEKGRETERPRDKETKGQEFSNQRLPSLESLSRESGRFGVGVETERLRDKETKGQEFSNQGIPSGESLSRESGRFGVGSKRKRLEVTRLSLKTGIVLTIVFSGLFAIMWFVLDRFTDSPVPQWDSFITSLSIVATWMLARKIYEHWLLWIIVNAAASLLFFTRGLYPTVVLYFIYMLMSFAGLKAWKGSIEPHFA